MVILASNQTVTSTQIPVERGEEGNFNVLLSGTHVPAFRNARSGRFYRLRAQERHTIKFAKNYTLSPPSPPLGRYFYWGLEKNLTSFLKKIHQKFLSKKIRRLPSRIFLETDPPWEVSHKFHTGNRGVVEWGKGGELPMAVGRTRSSPIRPYLTSLPFLCWFTLAYRFKSMNFH